MATTSSVPTTPGFSRLLEVEATSSAASGEYSPEQARRFCSELESGNIVYFPHSPIVLSADDRDFLLGHKQSGSGLHKNIAYRPAEDRVTGLDKTEAAEGSELRRVMRAYSENCSAFLSRLLAPYSGKWKLDFASFRPIEEEGRVARRHARNDLLHFDSFPTRPTNGARILRFFTNINPTENRVWITSLTFQAFGPKLAQAAGLDAQHRNPVRSGLRALADLLPFVGRKPRYDKYMHRCHNAMKEDENFQSIAPKHRWEFPPNSSWMVFTDCVSHAVLSGRYALEQTFLIPPAALVEPQRSPLAILEKLSGQRLTG
jgi:3-deoxy-D-manno-oct-2-ulosonic acid (Kdo) hydroxylase